jgi:hypothetical protein
MNFCCEVSVISMYKYVHVENIVQNFYLFISKFSFEMVIFLKQKPRPGTTRLCYAGV